MKHKLQFYFFVVSMFLLVTTEKTVYADLNASEIFNSFNSMNGGQGFRFVPDTIVSPTKVTLTTQTGAYQNVDNSAYSSGRSGSVGSPARTFFQTFCVAPDLPVSSVGLGKLNYDVTTGYSKTSQGYTLSIGAAYLYKEFATSLTPLGLTGNIDNAEYATAIRALMGLTIVSDWTRNVYLDKLLDIRNSISYWTEQYLVNQRYSEIGDYCVFVMNVTDTNESGPYQDFLYLAEATSISEIPEPATLLLWTLGGMGLFTTSLVRKHRKKKQTIACS